MKSYFIPEETVYSGKELAPHWIYKNHNIVGDAIVGFIGECTVKLDSMVDISDVLSNSPIYSKKMLHFIAEHFNTTLIEGVLRQRLLVNIAKEVVEDFVPNAKIIRKGDDLFFNGGKLSVSIATKSLTSVLIHLGINVDADGAPVKASGLSSELNLTDIQGIAKEIISRYCREYKEMIIASCKVRGVI